jgi:ribosomal protein S20
MLRQRMAMGAAITAAVVAGGIGGAVLGVPGVSGAQQGTTSTTVPGSANSNAPKVRHGFPAFEAAAKALNLTPEQLREKLSDHKTTIADVAKQQNVDINTVIDAMTQADRDRIEDMVNKPWPERGPGGPGGPGGGKHGGMGFGILGRFGAGLDDLAGALNTTTDQLKTDLRDGKTIKEIAEANNVDVNTVINKIVDAANKRIDEAVADGKLTKEQGDKIKSEVTEHVTEFVNNGLPKFPGFGPRGGFGNTP